MNAKSLMTVAILWAGAIGARTVALWPLEYDSVLGEFNLRSAVNTANDMWAVEGLVVTNGTPGWYLPPNPDATSGLLFTPGNRCAVTRTGNAIFTTGSTEISQLLNLRHDFTLEGWISIHSLKDGNWYVIANGNNGSSGGCGFIWSVRKTRANATDSTKKDITFEIYATGSVNDQIVTRFDTEEAQTALLTGWHHVAFAFTFDCGDGQCKYELFMDGESCGSFLHAQRAEKSTVKPGLELGGRVAGGNTQFDSSWDYWRLSDEVLKPEDFLCSGGSGTPVPAAITRSTVAYWPFAVDSNGRLDTRDYVGGADLHMGLLEKDENISSGVAPSSESAFSGNPPNSTVTLPGGNTGSIALLNTRAKLSFAGLGDSLETTNSFTVEGWFKPEERDDVTSDYGAISNTEYYHYLFNTRSSGNGWVLQYSHDVSAPGVRSFKLIVEDPSHEAGGYLVTSNLGTFGPEDPGWMHVALVYDHTAGNGTWSLYVNGLLVRSVENNWAPDGPSGGHDFMIGGRPGNLEVAFGKFDCVRVSQAALTTNQFLNATVNPAAATDVLALWPLNVKADGLSIDLTDVATGNWSGSSGTTYATATYLPTPVTGDAPSVANPDASGAVRSDVPDPAAAEFTGSRFLNTSDQRVLNVLGGKTDYTWECYLKQPNLYTSGWGVLMYVATSLSTTSPFGACMLNFTWRPAGFVILDGTHQPCNSTSDVTYPDTKDILGADTWHHVALTFSRTGGTDGKPCYNLYLDGTQCGSLSCKYDTDSTSSLKSVLFFGRFWSGNSFVGKVSAMRLSNRVLDPAEFLCGSQPLPGESAPAYRTGTIAYWPFEASGTAVDLSDRASGYVPSTNRTAAVVSALAEGAVTRVPRPDAQTGSVKANVGAVSLSRGMMDVSSLGLQLEYDHAFTVESWWRRAAGAAALPETLFGTYFPTNDAGWKVYVASNGDALQLRLLAKYPGNWSPVADGVLCADVSRFAGEWSHLAVAYDPNLGTCGRWTAYADGEELGHVDNIWTNLKKHMSIHRFGFGAVTTPYETGFTGDLDQGRVTGTALAPDSFLYAPPKGALIIIR